MQKVTKFPSTPIMRCWASIYALKRLDLQDKISPLDKGKIAKIAKDLEGLVAKTERNNREDANHE